MRATISVLSSVLLLFCFSISVAPGVVQAGGYDQLLEKLPKSKLKLKEGLKQAIKKEGEVAISGKFEFDKDGKLMLSVYTAENGLTADAEHNVLKELIGSPEASKWEPETEIFTDTAHVARASGQQTLMALSKFTLGEIIEKAEKDQKGDVFWIEPVMKDRKAQFLVRCCEDNKLVELRYDLLTGELIK